MEPSVRIITTNTTNTTEEVALSTAIDIQALRDQIEALSQTIATLAQTANRDTVTVADEPAPDVDETTQDESDETHEIDVAALAHVTSDANADGFVAGSVEVVRPDAPEAPPEPEAPNYEQQAGDYSYINTSGVDVNHYPDYAGGVRPSENTTTKHSRGRWGSRAGNNAVLEALTAEARWTVARGIAGVAPGCPIHHKTMPTRSIIDWVAYTGYYLMTVPQARTILKRLEQTGDVIRVGKSGKQDVWTINPSGPSAHRLS